jgi:hypothetical protein
MMNSKIKWMLLLALCGCLRAGAQTTPMQQVAAAQAQRMKDTLGLTTVQKDSIYQVNLRLMNEKHDLRSQYANNPALLRSKTQEVENTRDSRYAPILTPAQFTLYQQKKRNLLSGG